MQRAFSLTLVFVVGTGVGVGAAYAGWRPNSLERAILRTCGTREAPRGEDRCSVVVADALDAWFEKDYAGEATPVRSLDSGRGPTVQPRAAPDSAKTLEALAENYARTHPICRQSIGVERAWVRGFRGQPELFRDATDTIYLRATHDAYRAGAAYQAELAAGHGKP